MKKLILILITTIVVFSCGEGSGKYKYLILDNRGMIYECNFYNENEDGCIMFNNRPGENNTPGTPTIICGNYTIRKIK
jgi:hypothetical protein